MRKYWKLCLILTAIFSCVLMLIYRQKYYNIHYVLELMNIFKGKTEKIPQICNETSSNSSFFHSRSIIKEEVLNSNHWIEIFPGIYTYSSHVISKKVISLGYAYNIPPEELERISCKLSYENQTYSTKSTFKLSILNKQENSYIFYMTCWSNFDLGIPYAITYIKQNVSLTLPIFHKEIYTTPYAACVKPLPPIYFNTYKILEFIIYHSHIGIKHFIFYYTALSSNIRKLLTDVAVECGIFVELLPWNTPPGYVSPDHKALKLEPYFIDCIFHTISFNHSNFLLSLDLNEFVSLEGTDIKKLIHDNSPFDYLQFEKRLFCSEFPSNIIAEHLNIYFKTLLKTKMSKEVGQKINVIYDVSQMKKNFEWNGGFKKWLIGKNTKNRRINESSGVIFSYEKCTAESHNKKPAYIENDKMWKFKNAFFNDCSYVQAKKSFLVD